MELYVIKEEVGIYIEAAIIIKSSFENEHNCKQLYEGYDRNVQEIIDGFNLGKNNTIYCDPRHTNTLSYCLWCAFRKQLEDK